VGRILSLVMDGMPGAFAMHWLITESVFALLAAGLLYWNAPKASKASASFSN